MARMGRSNRISATTGSRQLLCFLFPFPNLITLTSSLIRGQFYWLGITQKNVSIIEVSGPIAGWQKSILGRSNVCILLTFYDLIPLP